MQMVWWMEHLSLLVLVVGGSGLVRQHGCKLLQQGHLFANAWILLILLMLRHIDTPLMHQLGAGRDLQQGTQGFGRDKEPSSSLHCCTKREVGATTSWNDL